MQSKDLISAFSRFTDSLEKQTKSRVSLKGFSDIDEYIHTGNYLLNAQMSGSLRGGYPMLEVSELEETAEPEKPFYA